MKGNWKSVTALALAVLLVAATPVLSGNARAADLDAECSLTVNAGSSELAEEMAEAGVVIDLYKVADAVKTPGFDAYTYAVGGDFTGLEIPENPTSEDWQNLEQQTATMALDGQHQPTVPNNEEGHEIPGLTSGLYLVIAHGETLTPEDYVTTVTGEDGVERIATIAESGASTYTFLPELVSLPSKEADENGVISTANPGEWLYEVEITLKPTQTPRLGAIEIVKTLTGYNPINPATFVFSIEATLRGQVVYSNVVSMVFTSAGTERLRVEGIPIGAEVTVTEVYSGATYRLVTDGTQTGVVALDTVAEFYFVNEPTTEIKYGGSITNTFDYNEEGGWTWTPIPDVP